MSYKVDEEGGQLGYSDYTTSLTYRELTKYSFMLLRYLSECGERSSVEADVWRADNIRLDDLLVWWR